MKSFASLVTEERLSGIILSISKDIQIIRALITKRTYLDLNDTNFQILLNDIKRLESEFIDMKHNRHKDSGSCHLYDFFAIHDELSDILYKLESM
jgi:hypothetical protein